VPSAADEVDPRVARTRRDVLDATARLLVDDGWDSVTHAEVARRAGYSKATLYAHWPTRLDLVRAAIDRLCDASEHPAPSGDLAHDVRASLADFAADLTDGHLDRLLAGVVERAGQSDVHAELRNRLYASGTSGLRAVLGAHLPADDVETVLELLTGAVLVHVSFAGRLADDNFVDDLVRRVLPPG
jgi:AcrR family transcriptional regulator